MSDDWEQESRPSTASSRRQLMAKKRGSKKNQPGLIMSTGNKPRRPMSSAGRKPTASTSSAQDDTPLVQRPDTAKDAALVTPVVPFDMEEMELVETREKKDDKNKKSIFEKKLELSGLEQTYDPKDRRWEVQPDQSGPQMAFAQSTKPPVQARMETQKLELDAEFPFKTAPEGQKVMCRIVRDKSSMDKSVFPTYYLFLESEDGQLSKQPILAARKRKRAKSSYYVISTNPEHLSRSSDDFAAKLRANVVGTHFTLYDSGVNPAKCQLPENLGRPLREELVHIQYVHGNSYVLNFGGRVTRPSVKNFQIIHESDTDYIILQFGRVEEHEFTMDYQYPMSALQAFGVCLTSFDGKLAVE
ncbi:hypothetical protein PTSG_05836 [Salpingoeca rosetta]|uniref:Tubby C-terminal domain-containing protein n=1 Tax=Salpingoeca rosetta (strain ATCC 50818 / BSB-021) TaxID=946362 RepID=F2UCX7_SALR5|nr:uncharacterized protein PTSG_05836 [Salpingoeca rosetta]EGD74472.1 hypothetical protein PTSG_05836 [Salpingoeca rosetta]|eukprot:XP_004992729.1 hypothetical protein PTSG_05836 [Salpingoeca rosetta]